MNISRRMGVAISGLAFAGAAVATIGAGGTANAQTATVTPQHAVASASTANRYRLSSSDGYTVDAWFYWWDSGCGCCC